MAGSPVRRYLDWLQADCPTGEVERYPQVSSRNETTLPGVFVAGDLTGVPLLRLAADSGVEVVRQLANDQAFQRACADLPAEVLEVLIIGAGPAGVSAALECRNQGLRACIIEANRPFHTIESFPRGKPILIRPAREDRQAHLHMSDGSKESLLAELAAQVAASELSIEQGVSALHLERQQGLITVTSNRGELRALRVILAIGKSGNPRRLQVPGEDLAKVFDRLFDPADHAGQQVLVVGGGDSALEASIALARAGAAVIHSYRKDRFSRPKAENLAAFSELVTQGKISPLYRSTVREIHEDRVLLDSPDGAQEISNDAVLVLIGRQLPVDLLQRSGIRLEGERSPAYPVLLTAMVSFFVMLYFGKKGNAYDLLGQADGLWAELKTVLLAPVALAHQAGLLQGGEGLLQQVLAGLQAPFAADQAYGVHGYQVWLNPLCFLIAWLGCLVFAGSGLLTLVLMLRRPRQYLGGLWPVVKNGYLVAAALVFLWVYVRSTYGTAASWVNPPTQWYSLLYCTTMAFFAARRAWLRRTRYITLQLLSLVLIQVLFLYLLPFQKIGNHYLFDLLIGDHFDSNGWLMQQVFPSGRWTSFWFILFWPLTIDAFGATTFWTIFPLVQLALLLWLISHYGKGVYCGWICSCGGMAETLGDEYRTLAPHGARAKRWENLGQAVLVLAVVVTLVHLLARRGALLSEGSVLASAGWGIYLLAVDIIFAGVLGLGVYFFLGGRIWCRYGCPLAAIMHVMTRFSRYRIFADKKRCISCNICTKVCHMGIDVMGYANRGIPMNDVECVRCSACIISCPMQVLAFGKLGSRDPANRSRQQVPELGIDDWRAGLR